MIWFRHTDPRYPFLWESAEQPPARWHGAGEGPVHYLADTPDGAWAEFLRHEEIRDVEDLAGVRRSLWAIDVPDEGPVPLIGVVDSVARGGLDSYPVCRAAARAFRRRTRARAFLAPSAAVAGGGAHGWRVDGGELAGEPRDAMVLVAYGRRPDLVGWAAAHTGQPEPRLLSVVRPL